MSRLTAAVLMYFAMVVLVVVLIVKQHVRPEAPTQCIRTDLSDLPPEALVAPRELSDGIRI